MTRDFAFAPPHRITMCRPQASEKTLCDVSEDRVKVSWSYDSLKNMPVNVWKAPRVEWAVELSVWAQGARLPFSDWKRPQGWLPGVEITGGDTIRFEMMGMACREGDIFRIRLENTTLKDEVCQIRVQHTIGGWVISNPAWFRGQDGHMLLCMESEVPDRIIIMGDGADSYPVYLPKSSVREMPVPMEGQGTVEVPGRTMTMEKKLSAGEKAEVYLFRPYQAYARQAEQIRMMDMEARLAEACGEWQAFMDRGAQVFLGDEDLTRDFYACLADIFVMREEDAAGHMVTSPGTEVYRSTNTTEPMRSAVVMDRMGFCREALQEHVVHVESQGEDGNWNDPLGWGHDVWCCSGFKALAVMEYCKNHRDLDYLRRIYPRMLASSRWNERMRRTTLNDPNPLYRGLLPRGMGDCGLMNEGDYFGVFYPHNFYAAMGDRVAAEAARMLGYEEDARELEQIWQTAREALRTSLKDGWVSDGEDRWIPGVPGKKGGSTWAALTAHYPCGILEKDDPLLMDTFRMVERHRNAGGQPVGNGWMQDGCWVAMSLDNNAQAHLAAGRCDEAAQYLPSTLRHASKLITWCEERGKDAGTTQTSGDMQHLWTPMSVCDYTMEALATDWDGELHLIAGLPRECLAEGKKVVFCGLNSHFGPIDCEALRQGHAMKITLSGPETAHVHLRTPEMGWKIVSSVGCDARVEQDVLILEHMKKAAEIRLECI